MIPRFSRIAGALAVATALAIPVLLPATAQAHWGVCANDPKVWLTNGSKIEMDTSVQADASVVSQITFTLHVPAGTDVSQIVPTGGSHVPPETVTVVADSASGYTATALATTPDGTAYAMSLTVHVVDGGSAWAGASGTSNQPVSTTITPS